MTDPVEAVARVICPDAFNPAVAEENGWADFWAERKAKALDAARAVIPVVLERLREPTPAMLDAFVSRALQVSIDGEGGWSAYGRNQWQAMLDAAIRGLE